jgi:two-component system nitrate/nitrite response regulator NarL
MDHSLTDGPAAPARVLMADDDAPFRTSLRQLLEAPPSVIAEVYGVDIGGGFKVVGEAGTGEDIIRLVNTVSADIVLLDVAMPAMSGLQALRELPHEDGPRIILLAGAIARGELVDAIRLGVRGLVLKGATAEVMLEAIRWVLEGRCWLDHFLMTDFIETAKPLIQSSQTAARGARARLTRREREVLSFIVAGYANKDIARASAVTEDSIKHHLTRIFEKLGVSNRLELAMLATEHGLLDALPELPS